MNDFVERTLLLLSDRCGILGNKVTELTGELQDLKTKYDSLLACCLQLQKNYEDILSLVLEQ